MVEQQMEILPRKDVSHSKLECTLAGTKFIQLIAAPIQRMRHLVDDIIELHVETIGDIALVIAAIDPSHVATAIYRLSIEDMVGITREGESFSINIIVEWLIKAAKTIDPAENIILTITPDSITFAGFTIPRHAPDVCAEKREKIEEIESYMLSLPELNVTGAISQERLRLLITRVEAVSDLFSLRIEDRNIYIVARCERNDPQFKSPIETDSIFDLSGQDIEGIYSSIFLANFHVIPDFMKDIKGDDKKLVTIKWGNKKPLILQFPVYVKSRFTYILAPRVEE